MPEQETSLGDKVGAKTEDCLLGGTRRGSGFLLLNLFNRRKSIIFQIISSHMDPSFVCLLFVESCLSK